MPTTTYALPYPADDDFVIDGPSAVQALAEATDDALAQVAFDADQAAAAEAATRAAADTAEAAARAAADDALYAVVVHGTGRLESGRRSLTTGTDGQLSFTFTAPFPSAPVVTFTVEAASGALPFYCRVFHPTDIDGNGVVGQLVDGTGAGIPSGTAVTLSYLAVGADS